jgi:hypothetical protein
MPGRIGDLTTLNNVKNWRTPVIATSADDPQIQREITAASKAILQTIQRNLTTKTYIEPRNGQGTQGIKLLNYPVVKVNSLYIDGTQVQQSTSAPTYGWVCNLAQGMLYLRGWVYTSGFQNIEINYDAGFLIPDEPATVGSDAKIQCSSLFELWSLDYAVKYADGTPLTAVKSTPAEGQYVPATAPDGFYLFNTADVSEGVLVSYSYTEKDIEEATILTTILEYNRRARVGENGKSLAGENVTYYTQKGMLPVVMDRLQSYIDVVPNE